MLFENATIITMNAKREIITQGALVVSGSQIVAYAAHGSEVDTVVIDGKIVKTGGKELATTLEEKGYSWLEEKVS